MLPATRPNSVGFRKIVGGLDRLFNSRSIDESSRATPRVGPMRVGDELSEGGSGVPAGLCRFPPENGMVNYGTSTASILP